MVGPLASIHHKHHASGALDRRAHLNPALASLPRLIAAEAVSSVKCGARGAPSMTIE